MSRPARAEGQSGHPAGEGDGLAFSPPFRSPKCHGFGRAGVDRSCDAAEAGCDLGVGVPLELPGRHVLQGGVPELFHQPLALFGDLRRQFGGRVAPAPIASIPS